MDLTAIFMGEGDALAAEAAALAERDGLERVIEVFREKAQLAAEESDHLSAFALHDIADTAERVYWGIPPEA